ncbi:MAG: S-layer homology domain-containing protein [Oscillospiraceae bacterium]
MTDKAGGNYIVSGTTTFEILPKSIEDAVITLSNALTYNGIEQTQNVTVTLVGFDAVTFDISNNKQTDVNASGNYTLTVTGNGNFTGSKDLDWNIAPATPIENPAKKTTARVIKGKTLADATVTNGEILALDGTTVLTGTFAWIDSTKVMSAGGTEQMVFTPESTNYAPITIDVAVSTYTTGGGVSTYAITVESTQNGDVTSSRKTASKGTTVTLTVVPDKGYTLETLTVTDKNGSEIELTNQGAGKYTFTMPASKVTIKATFMEDNSMLNFFVDVFPGDYYYDAVLWAAKNGITGGTGDGLTFSPNAPCTRAQVVTFLWRAAGCPEPESSANPFTDVKAGSYCYKAVLWAVENGITIGTGDGTTFSPNATCSRGQIVTFLWRSQQSPAAAGANSFTDVAADSYCAKAVQWAVESGITNGSGDGTTFSPKNDCTRAQIVTFLYRFFVK